MTETFSAIPEKWREVHTQRGMVTPPEAGALKTRRINQGTMREFKLEWRNAPPSVKMAIQADHAATYGGASTMLWTPPGETDEIRVRFKPGKDGYSRRRSSATNYAISVGLVEAPEFRTPSSIT